MAENNGTDTSGNAKLPEAKADTVFRALLEAIQGGMFPAGSKLPSNDALAKQYSVSRVSVRSALERLKGLGLLTSERGGGTYVCAPQKEGRQLPPFPPPVSGGHDRMSIFEFRRIVEGESAALAAMRATTEQVDAMRAATVSMRDAADLVDQRRFDMEFHQLIAKATGNPMLISVFDLMQPSYDYLIEGNVRVMGASGAAYHEKILAAIEVRDAALAKACMDEHLVNAMQETRSIN